MHSARLLFQNRWVEWENLKNMSWEISIQQTVEVIQHFGTDKSVPYAPTGGHPIQHHAKFLFTGAVPVEGPRSCGLIAQGS